MSISVIMDLAFKGMVEVMHSKEKHISKCVSELLEVWL